MGDHVGVLTPRAGKCEQGDAGEYRGEAAAPVAIPVVTAAPHEGRADAQRTEARGGGADGAKPVRLDPGVQSVPQGSAGEDQKPAEAGTQVAADEQAEQRTEQGVRNDVAQVPVQGERRDAAPPFAGGHEACLKVPGFAPVPAEGVIGLQ